VADAGELARGKAYSLTGWTSQGGFAGGKIDRLESPTPADGDAKGDGAAGARLGMATDGGIGTGFGPLPAPTAEAMTPRLSLGSGGSESLRRWRRAGLIGPHHALADRADRASWPLHSKSLAWTLSGST